MNLPVLINEVRRSLADCKRARTALESLAWTTKEQRIRDLRTELDTIVSKLEVELIALRRAQHEALQTGVQP